MQWYEISLDFIARLAWPAVTAFALIYYRAPMTRFIDRIRRAKGPGFEIEIEALAETALDLANAGTPATQPSAEPGEQDQPDDPELQRSIDELLRIRDTALHELNTIIEENVTNPKRLIRTAWNITTLAVTRISKTAGVPTRLRGRYAVDEVANWVEIGMPAQYAGAAHLLRSIYLVSDDPDVDIEFAAAGTFVSAADQLLQGLVPWAIQYVRAQHQAGRGH